jgi:hypothetical protein
MAAAVAMLLFALASAAQARSVVFNEDVWFQFSGATFCGGEEILFEGTNHMLI